MMDTNMILSDDRLLDGAPLIVGTLVTARQVLDDLAAGQSLQEVTAHRGVTIEQVKAAVDFALEVVEDLRWVPPSWQDLRITATPDVMVGKPCVQGTRLTVECLLEKVSSGWTREEIFESYPRLTPEGLQAVLAFAGYMVSTVRVYPTNRAAS